MRTAGTVSTATAAICLLLLSGACSRQRCFARHENPPWRSGQERMPGATETAGQAPYVDSAERMSASRPRLWSRWQEAKCKLWTDCQNYYSWDIARHLLLGIGAASLLANTSMDQDVRDWYQDDVRSSSTDDLADACKALGDGRIFIPAFAGLAMVSGMYDQTPCGSVVAEFTSRTTRGCLVGTPALLFMQCCLGSSRPGESKYQSRWRPFDDNNAASGHAFIGALPFIAAAKMTESPCLKGGLYACSTLTAWSAIDHDRHYLSQACLGWWMAYLASVAVDNTEHDYEHLTFTPVATPEMVGVGVVYER